ncbi:Ubiquitin-protein ligase [Trachipleistophora hominis]|uniref:Ubiquitin-protein ligase n=1 Tax=Trachipleistophora hominis TaxID=72359 RepID=L7JV42_TRAHO|nr:Ubiquitin-protein ligase [Trachipleistophora hominis]
MSTHLDRLLAEQANLKKERKYMFFARPSSKDATKWDCGFPGPDTPLYKGSYYLVSLSFGRTYPFKPPNVKFVHRVFHPNVYLSGDVCLDILGSGWKPSFTVSSILCALQQLLITPNVNSPANGPATRAYGNKEVYEKEVRKNIERWHTKLPW